MKGIDMPAEKTRTVEIPESLFERIGALISGTRFRSVSEYVVYMLREQIAKEEIQKTPAYSKDEEEKIKDRLRALGYI